MARCKTAELLHKIGVPQIDDFLEVTFSLYADVTHCVSINTRDYTEISELNHYAMYDRPENRYDCYGGFCATTGTLYVDVDETAHAVFYKAFDATEYASGVVTFYIKMDSIASGDSAVVAISDTSDFTNGDQYTIELGEADADGYVPVLVDLSQTPTEIGTGWEPSNSGAYISIGVTNDGTGKAFGVSTITFYKSLYDLAQNAIVKIGCLSEVGGTFDVPALEETCLNGGYDKNGLTSGIERTITGKKMTSNYWMLNPLAGMNRFAGDVATTEGFRVETVKKTIASDGTVTIADMADDCDFIGAQIDDKCVTPTADMLYRIQSPVAVELGYDQFQVLPSEDGHVFYFNTDLAGKDVLITYPQKVELKERVIGNKDNIGEVRVKMSYPWKYNDGTEEIHTFNNVLITSFPASITNEESEFTFTVTIFPDADGNWFTVQRVLA